MRNAHAAPCPTHDSPPASALPLSLQIAKDVIQSATDATRFSTEDFYKRRRDIQAAIFTALVAELAPLGADVKAFQVFCRLLQTDNPFSLRLVPGCLRFGHPPFSHSET